MNIVIEARIDIRDFAALLRYYNENNIVVRSRGGALSTAIRQLIEAIDISTGLVRPNTYTEAEEYVQACFPDTNIYTRKNARLERAREEKLSIGNGMLSAMAKMKGSVSQEDELTSAVIKTYADIEGISVQEAKRILDTRKAADSQQQQTEDTSDGISVKREPDTYDKGMFAPAKLDSADYVQK